MKLVNFVIRMHVCVCVCVYVCVTYVLIGFDDAMPTFDDFSTLLLNCDFSKWTKMADCLNVSKVTLSTISEKLVGDELRDKKAFLSVLSSWREKAPVRKEDKKATWRNLRNSLAEFDDIVEQIEKIKAG